MTLTAPQTPANEQVILREFGDAEQLSVSSAPMPAPGPGEVRVRMLAASVQFTDTMIREGKYPDVRERPPLVLGYDVVGEIDALGAGVQEFVHGERVADLTTIGSYARYRLLRAERLTRVPREVDPAQACALVLSWVTAYQLLHRHAKVSAGQVALVQGAAGAVGQALLALARIAGLQTFGTCSAEHADLVASLGATPIDYRNERFEDVVQEGVDVVFDGISERGFKRSFSVLKPGGFLSAYGMSDVVKRGGGIWAMGLAFAQPFLWNVWPNGRRAGFYSITKVRTKHPHWFQEDLVALLQMLKNGEIQPRIHQRIELKEVPQAHARLSRGRLDGKIMIVAAER